VNSINGLSTTGYADAESWKVLAFKSCFTTEMLFQRKPSNPWHLQKATPGTSSGGNRLDLQDQLNLPSGKRLQFANLKMAIEILDLPIDIMVTFQFVM